MTRHDEVRQILHDAGFQFKDGRTALDMTDEEVDLFVVEFIARMSELGRQLAVIFQRMARSLVHAFEPFYDDMGLILKRTENPPLGE
jgi:hypothetical protein